MGSSVAVVTPAHTGDAPRWRAAARGGGRGGELFGRAAELARARAALERGARLVTLRGPSGAGKTALLARLAAACADAGLTYHWLAPPLEPPTPAGLTAAVAALGRAAGRGRCALLIDDVDLLRAIEPWLVERFLPRLPTEVTVIAAGRGPAPSAACDLEELELGPLAPAAVEQLLVARGVPPPARGPIAELAEGNPALLAAAIARRARAAARADRGRGDERDDSEGHGGPAGRDGPADRHEPAGGGDLDDLDDPAGDEGHGDRDDLDDPAAAALLCAGADAQRLSLAVLCAARATPYELLELAFDHAREAQDAYAWLGRLAVVETTARGLAPHLRFRDQCARRLARAEPALWAHAQAVVRELTAHRITVAPDPAPWVLDRLYVDRELAAVRAHVTLPTSDPGLVLERGAPEEVAAVIGAAGGPAAADLPASALARWLATDRAELDLVRDARGALVGYACCVAVTAAAPLDDPDPPLALAGRHLQAVDWFGAATPPDARALVVRCLRTLGASGAPAARALLLAQLAGRVLTQPTLEVLFIVASEPAPAIALLRFAGLAPHAVGEVGRGPARRAVIAADLRGLAPGPGLERAAAAAAAAAPARPAPAQRPSPAVPPPPAPTAPPDLGEAIARRLGELAARAGLSPREQEVLSLLLLGRNAAEIGTALAIAPRTARFHQANALAKVGAESRLDVLRLLM